MIDDAGREWGGVGGKTIAVEGTESEDDAEVDAIESFVGVGGRLLVWLFIGFRYEIGVLHNGLIFYKNKQIVIYLIMIIKLKNWCWI